MAFLSRVGSILKQSVSKQIGIGSQISASNPSIFQALRCMSSSKVFVGGLPWAVDDSSLREIFSKYGDVIDAKVIVDREQDRSRGFGFVTFASTEEASSAIQALDGQDLQGRRVKVDYATERAPRSFGDGGYGGGGGGYGGGYGGGGGYSGGGGQQNFGGGGGYGGGQYGGGNSGGYGGGVAAGTGDSFYGGGDGNVTADPGFGGPVGNDAGGDGGGVAAGNGDFIYSGDDNVTADAGFGAEAGHGGPV